MRRPVVAGNWKMNPSTEPEAVDLAEAVAVASGGLPVETVVCPPAIWLPAVARAVGGGSIGIGAQMMRAEERGAFTGEISPLMLAGLAGWVIVGHSECRQYLGETDERVAAKVASAVAHGLRPIVAVGEDSAQRRTGGTAAVIDRQVRAAISQLDALEGSGLVIAYEPVWAIGTGEAASGDDAQRVAAQVRAILREADPIAADAVPILYGGSVAPGNAAEFFEQPDIDGALVGGASLEPETFAAILRAAAASVS